MELGINIIGAEIVFEMILILCFDVLIFVVKDQLCSINYSKKKIYVTLLRSYLEL